jgi:hypothetical protein
MKSTKQTSLNVGYVYLQEIADGAVKESVPVESFVLDIGVDGTLLGIEFLDLSKMPTVLRDAAEEHDDVG